MEPKENKMEFILESENCVDEKLTVQKSLPLFALWRSELTLAEFKILDAYLAAINSHDPENRVVQFEKGRLEQILGVTKINISDLRERLKHLGTMVQIDDPLKTQSFRLIALFEQAECEQDEDGLWKVTLECTQKAMKYIFNIENLGYLRYKLRTIVSLTSRYSYILFLYLEKNRFRKTWEIAINDLKEILYCENDDFYREFRYFNQRILKRCHKELNEKTGCHFTYEPIKRRHTVKAIRFTLETLSDLNPTDIPQLRLEEYSEPEDHIAFLQEACRPSDSQESEFSRAEMEQIFEVIVTVPDDQLPSNVPTGSLLFRRYHYLSEKYAALNRAAEKKTIQNRFAYFLKMLKSSAA